MRSLPIAVPSLAALVLAVLAAPAPADIVGVGGATVLATPPADISNGLWTSDTEIRAWPERQLTLGAALPLDHVGTGPVTTAAELVPGSVPSGTAVRSYMVRFDPATSGTDTLSGFIVFDTAILGLLLDRPTLLGTDALLGRPGVLYNTNNQRGMEMGGAGDTFQISADRLRLDFTMRVIDGPTDDIRIITAVPAPGAIALLGLAGWGAASAHALRLMPAPSREPRPARAGRGDLGSS